MSAVAMMGKEAMARTPPPTARFHDARTANHAGEEPWIGLEINAGKLYQLLMCGAVSVTDFHCLDRTSKCRVRTLCLHACAHRLHESAAGIAPSGRIKGPS